jgi:hypothetical protein
MFGGIKGKLANEVVGKALQNIQLLEHEDSSCMILKKQGEDIRVLTVTLVKVFATIDNEINETLAISRIISNLSVADSLS